MASNKTFMFGPLALTTTLTTNILNPGTTTGGVNSYASQNLFIIIRHIRILNKTTSSATFTLYKGATGANTAGTEFIGTAMNVAANSANDYIGIWPFYSADFLVGGASANTTLTIEGEGEIGLQ